jgi:hypothetical protein
MRLSPCYRDHGTRPVGRETFRSPLRCREDLQVLLGRYPQRAFLVKLIPIPHGTGKRRRLSVGCAYWGDEHGGSIRLAGVRLAVCCSSSKRRNTPKSRYNPSIKQLNPGPGAPSYQSGRFLSNRG